LCRIELLPRTAYEVAYTPHRPIIGFAFEAQSGMHAFASSRKEPFLARPNHLSFVPAGCDVYSQSIQGGEYLHIALECAAAECRYAERRFSNVIDAAAIGAAERLRRLTIGGDGDPLTIEHLVSVLNARAMAVLTGEVAGPRAASWMTQRRLRLTLEHVESRLGGKLTVHELAAEVGLSAGFFSRVFKAAVGKAPHEYVIDRRVALARKLLQEPGHDLSAIAQASGFSSHAHMSSVFHNRLGVTPSELRRSRSM
jgi:AraC family transcriptional regulator